MTSSHKRDWFKIMSPFAFGRMGVFPGGPQGFDTILNSIHMGWWWMRIKGGHNVRFSPPNSRKVPTFDDPIGGITDKIDGSGNAPIQSAPWINPAVGYSFIVRISVVGKTGVENVSNRQVREITIQKVGSPGAVVDPSKPNKPMGFHVTAKSDGTFTLYWRYDPKNQEIAPTHFNVYWAEGSTPLVNKAPGANVAYESGKEFYSYTTGVIANSSDTVIHFIVRASRDTSGNNNQERNLNEVIVVGRTTAPYGTVSTKINSGRGYKQFPLREK